MQEVIWDLEKELNRSPQHNLFIYHPVKDDVVDRRLADYINS